MPAPLPFSPPHRLLMGPGPSNVALDSLSQRALEVALNRKTKVQSWHLDVNLLASYWGQGRVPCI